MLVLKGKEKENKKETKNADKKGYIGLKLSLQ